MKVIKLPSNLMLSRRLLPLVLALLPLLVMTRWAAKELPLGSAYVNRSATWLDDRFVLISETSSPGRNRWGAPNSSKLYLFDCQRNRWFDLQERLGVAEFDTELQFTTVDNCFCFLDQQGRLLKLNPLDESFSVQSWVVGSQTGVVVGNQYYIFKGRCLDVVRGEEYEFKRSESNGMTPVEGSSSIILSYRYSNPESRFSASMGSNSADTTMSVEGMDVEAATESIEPVVDELAENSQDDSIQLDLPVLTQQFSADAIDRPEFLEYEWYDLEIQQEAILAGRDPSDLELRVLYSITDGQAKQIAKWVADHDYSYVRTSQGLIADLQASGKKIAVRDGDTGELIRTIVFPPSLARHFQFDHGVVLFFDHTHRIVIALDVISGEQLSWLTDFRWVSKTSEFYAVIWSRLEWRNCVYELPQGSLIRDITNLDYSSLDFSQDGRSLKMLTDRGAVIFLDLKSGHVTTMQPLRLRTWLCWVVGLLAAGWYLLWRLNCHREQRSIQMQSVVCASLAALISWWRLELAPTELVVYRPAFFIFAGASIWLGLWLTGKLISSCFPWYLKVIVAQIVFYVWYSFFFRYTLDSYRSEENARVAISILIAFAICLAVFELRALMRKQWTGRFTLTSILLTTFICAVTIHQVQLLPWQTIFKNGIWKTMYHSSIAHYAVFGLLVVLVSWLSKQAYRLPRISVLVCLIGLAIALFGRDAMHWYGYEIDPRWFGSNMYDAFPLLLRGLIFVGTVFFIRCNFSDSRAKAQVLNCGPL